MEKRTTNGILDHRKNLALWIVISLAPFLAVLLIQVPLNIRHVSREIALISPYWYFSLLVLFSVLPSYLFILHSPLTGAAKARVIAVFTASLVVYIPLILSEFFFTACAIFGNCHLL
jgi:FtsH-binding integral membrane protein